MFYYLKNSVTVQV